MDSSAENESAKRGNFISRGISRFLGSTEKSAPRSTPTQGTSVPELGLETPVIEEVNVKKLEVHNLGESFKPFDSPHKVERISRLVGWDMEDNEINAEELSSDLAIEIEGLPQIPFNFRTKVCKHMVLDTITPYHPDNGYVIDQRDLNIDRREQKHKEILDRIGSEDLAVIFDPLGVFIDSAPLDPKDFGFSPETMELFFSFINRMRLQLTIPGTPDKSPLDESFIPPTVLESRPTILVLNSKPGIFTGTWVDVREDFDRNGKVEIQFDRYYPEDYGPLPTRKVWDDEDPWQEKLKKLGKYENTYPFIYNGFRLALPADPKVPGEIEAGIVLMPEAADEKQENSTESTNPSQYIPPLGAKAKK